MSDSNPSANPAPRATLKLKTAPRKAPAETNKITPLPRPQTPANGKHKPGAHWSDEYKERMQADMDALARR